MERLKNKHFNYHFRQEENDNWNVIGEKEYVEIWELLVYIA
jgi:hypothetical protein